MKLDLPEEVCDVHVHVGEYFSGIDVSFPLEKLTKIMDKYRIECALVCSSEVNLDKETLRIIKALKNNRKLYALIRTNSANYKLPEYLRSMERLLQNNDRIIGLKVNPSTEKHRITDDIYKGALEVLNDRNAVLLLHCGRWLEMSGWQYGIEVARHYPKINVILAHMGGTHPDLSFPAIEASRPLTNVWMDTSQTRQIVVLERGIEKLGAERIFFGSDMPWGDYLQNLVGILQLKLNESQLNKVLRENFKKITMKE
jgi:hypothetical protein